MDDLYTEAARVLREVDWKRESFRNLIFQSHYKNKKQLYKICLETMKRKGPLREMIASCQFLTEEFADDQYLLSILLYEYLYGITGLRRCRNRSWRKVMQEHEQEMKDMKAKFDSSRKNMLTNDDDKDDTEFRVPRYARVNTLKCELAEAVACVEEDGGVKVVAENEKRKSYLRRVRSLAPLEFCIDPVISNLLVFASGTDLHDYRLVTDGRLVLQDKSSCLSAVCLNPPPGSVVLDLCAAPGMKTSHLAALMENSGRIFAIDKDERRTETMRGLLMEKGVSCVDVLCQDFLALDLSEKKFRKATHILLDPPCTGSGISNRCDQWVDESQLQPSIDERRVNSLGNLQAMMLKRVLSANLQRVQRIVYSTCSIHERENEQVIQEAMGTASAAGYQLVNALQQWKHRGSRTYDFGALCLRASPKNDATNGFFVAVFERQFPGS